MIRITCKVSFPNWGITQNSTNGATADHRCALLYYFKYTTQTEAVCVDVITALGFNY